MNANNVLLNAVEAAARKIERLARAVGTPYSAAQNQYGCDWEALVDGEWIDCGCLDGDEKIEAVRIYDCDGERSDECETAAEVETVRDAWIERLSVQ